MWGLWLGEGEAWAGESQRAEGRLGQLSEDDVAFPGKPGWMEFQVHHVTVMDTFLPFYLKLY